VDSGQGQAGCGGECGQERTPASWAHACRGKREPLFAC
jgi:hypothetical protein